MGFLGFGIALYFCGEKSWVSINIYSHLALANELAVAVFLPGLRWGVQVPL